MVKFMIALGALALMVPATAQAADKKQPPACAAVSFRPLANTANDGESTSGHYRSRFGTIDVMARVQGGQASYHLQVNGKPAKALDGDIPRSSFACLNSKHVKTPPQRVGGTCTGERFRVVVDSAAKPKLYMLYALQGEDWKLCEAGTES